MTTTATLDTVAYKHSSGDGNEFDLGLRPHHVLGFIAHELHPELYGLSDQEYLALWRQQKGNIHSDRLVILWRDTIKRLHENPDLRFKYVPTLDDVCKGCEHREKCYDSKNPFYAVVTEADRYSAQQLPELKFGAVYDGHYLRSLSLKKVG